MKRRNEVLVGVFVTVALIIGVLGTLWLSRSGLLSDTYPLYTRFRWGANLKQGQEVWLAGFAVGTVDRVELRPDGWLDVWMVVEEKYTVPEGSIAQLKTASFFGDMAINLEPPLNYRSAVQPGDTIPAAPPPPTMDALLSRLDSVSRGVSDVAQAFEIQMVREGGIQDLKGTISSTNRLVLQISRIADEQSRELTRLTRNLNRSVSAIDSAVVDSTMRNIRQTTANLAQLSSDFQDTRERMTALLTKLESGDGSAAKLLNDPGLYNDVRALVQRVDSLTADFKKNPRKYINLEIF
ncbi:MAG TPA: MlaD family protein [Gemmatimonadaceae bacterium]|nr:MlaD family protein [Gemmatimonadaceae bacterium]